MASKKTSELIPFCHPIPLESCKIDINIAKFKPGENIRVEITCIAKTTGKTGVEMEALVGASNAALCIYDMLKAASHGISIESIRLLEKQGGKSGYISTTNS